MQLHFDPNTALADLLGRIRASGREFAE
eukprot:SAG25_NODE_10276_length_340_cov_0.854772_1_plen_27_part_10